MSATTNSHSHKTGFTDDAFPLSNFDDYPNGTFCDLANENLFPAKLCDFATTSPLIFKLVLPAPKHASRFILVRPEAYPALMDRNPPQDLNGFSNLSLDCSNSHPPRDKVISTIRKHLPRITFDPDISKIGTEYHAYTILKPDADTDLVAIDYTLIRLLTLQTARIYDTQKISALIVIAVIICHHVAHVLEFRTTRGGQLQSNGLPFSTPLGITCGEAGSAWEMQSFGGKLGFCCDSEGSLMTLRGLAIHSHMWDFNYRSVYLLWSKDLFSESFWRTTELSLICFTNGFIARRCI